eukprot:5713194-Pyramimonas_sp.AAC.1
MARRSARVGAPTWARQARANICMWDFGWGPLWGDEAREGRVNWVRRAHAHANAGSRAFGGAPYGAAKRARGAPTGR